MPKTPQEAAEKETTLPMRINPIKSIVVGIITMAAMRTPRKIRNTNEVANFFIFLPASY